LDLALRSKAEIVLGSLLVMRHRTPALAGVLALAVFLPAHFRGSGVERQVGALLLAGGTVGAVAASRLMSPGPALSAAWRVAGPGYLAPAGRLVGAGLVTLPFAWAAVLLVGWGIGEAASVGRLGAAVTVFTLATMAVVMAMTPLVGSSSAAAIGLAGVWVGGLSPSVVLVTLERWPAVQRPLVLAWNVLPLNWRAFRWAARDVAVDGVLLGIWIVGGIGIAAWSAAAGARWHRPRGGSGW
jgi:hypothetical protein